jgi:RUN domain-containing protein 1
MPPQITFSGKLYQMISKASTIFQIFALSQMGCASPNAKNFKKNTLKKTTRGNHWGDTRAKLEVDIREILALVF